MLKEKIVCTVVQILILSFGKINPAERYINEDVTCRS